MSLRGHLRAPALLTALFLVLAARTAGAEEKKREPFLLRPLLGYSTAGLRLEPTHPSTGESGDHALVWQPNSAAKVGARAGYGPFLVTATMDWQPPDDQATHGTSKGVEIVFTSSFRFDEHEIAAALYFQRYSGFYLDTTKAIFPRAETPLLAPRMVLSTWGVNFMFFLDPKFSYDDAFVEYRPREAGEFSWGMRLGLGRFEFDAGANSLIPGKLEAEYGDAFGISALGASYASLGLGFAVDWRPFGKALIGTSLFAGGTVAAAAYRISGYTRRRPLVGPSAAFQLVLGYVDDLFHFGLLTTADLDGMHIEGAEISSQRAGVLGFFGVRF